MKITKLALLISALAVNFSAQALTIKSKDIQEGHPLSTSFVFNGWGCTGQNLSPQLSWSNVPVGTKSFAVTAYDPDAPTGSGFWHWLAVNIPVKVTELERGANLNQLGANVFRNDYGSFAFGGACPPKGDGMHRYEFTIWALPVDKLELPKGISAAVVGFNLNSMAIDKAVLTATYTSH